MAVPLVSMQKGSEMAHLSYDKTNSSENDETNTTHSSLDNSVDSTKVSIAKAYFDLVKKGNSKSISVKDVVEHAGVSRMTFYYHFQDIYDLVDWSLRSIVEKTLKGATSVHEIWHILADDIVDVLENNRYGFLDCFQYLDDDILRRNFSQLFFEIAYASLKQDHRLDIYSTDDKRFLARLMSYCLLGILGDLLDHSTNVDVEDYIERFNRLVVGKMIPNHQSSDSTHTQKSHTYPKLTDHRRYNW